jgi:phosphoribosylformimino-5-aminoimidazole carboxamide ribotide isomerase
VSEINLHTLKEVIQVGRGRALIQFGGGLRSIETLDAVLSAGVARVILGTAAVKNPESLILALKTFGSEKIVLGIDAKDGFMQIEGWESNARVTPAELVERFVGEGLKTVIYTNIRHDGMQNGVDVESTKELADTFNLDIIASGGVGRLEDIKKVKSAGLSGVVVGKALYEKQFSLKEAIQC